MSEQSPTNYSSSVAINSDTSSAYTAIAQAINQWWSTTEGDSDQVNGEFKISFGVESYWCFKVLELVPNHKIVWECIESHQDHNLKGLDHEWLHSKLHWSIDEHNDGITVDFLHEGLLSDGVCYDVCSTAWDFYILDSLKSYLETGVGKPGQN